MIGLKVLVIINHYSKGENKMEKKGKIIIGVVVAILVILVAGFLILSNFDVTLMGDGAQVTLPNNYTVDDTAVASAGNVSVVFTPVVGSSDDNEAGFQKAIKANGKSSGYENITNDTINGFKVFEYAAKVDKLQNVSTDKVTSGDTTTWMTYEPYLPFDSQGTDHFRSVSYIKGDKVNYLIIYTDNPDTSLYTPEIDNIINSIAVMEQ